MALLLTLIIASSTLTELESEVKMILEESQPYVVTVTAGDMVASGTVVDEKGYIVTGLLPQASEFEIQTWDGRKFKASIVGRDEVMGLTLIATGEKLLSPRFAGSVETGDIAVVIGNPLGVKKAVQLGLVSGIKEDGRFYLSIPSEMGLTGAGVFNSRGELIGVLSSILSPLHGIAALKSSIPQIFQTDNLFLMVPIDTIKNRIKRILATGNLSEAWLGIAAAPGKSGVIVKRVISGSPADRAGLKRGDIIIEAEGQKVQSPDELRNLIRGKSPGDTIEIVLEREGKRLKLHAQLDKKPFYFRKIVPFEYPEAAVPEWDYEKLKEEIQKYREEMEALTDSLRKEIKKLKELKLEEKSKARI
ncbi:MAG: PDZ domain-containing protein [Candidatus Hydrothermae bacterium]|nr:PDZ domain-containing protein [Candidatus Hydrothermae bacterium]